jgi:xylulokinase
LKDGTPLINGGQDHSTEALALGMISPGSFFLACGTAWVINAVTASSEVDALPSQMALNPHVIPERWVASQFLGGLGAGMEWWLDQFWQTPPPGKSIPRDERFASFDAALTRTMPGSSGLLFFPVSGVPRSEDYSGGYSGMRLDHTRADMGRAVLESAAYELRWALDDIRKYGFSASQLWMVGGATRSPVWSQILADVTGVPISLTQYSHGPALGAAILAARRLGYLDGFPAWVSAQTIQPDPKNAKVYDEMYAAYRGVFGKSANTSALKR